jgi:ABC-type glycerol-3-phosphate transport system permease component
MPIISSIQRKSPGGRLLIALMYIVLTVGAVTMVYPFLLLVSGSVKSEVDVRDLDVFPKFFLDDLTLFKKYEAQRYGDKVGGLEASIAKIGEINQFQMLEKPDLSHPEVLKDWRTFIGDRKSWPMHFFTVGHTSGYNTVAELALIYRNRIMAKHPEIPKRELFNDKSSGLKNENWPSRIYHPMEGPLAPIYDELRSELPARYFIPENMQGMYISYLRTKARGEKALKEFNQRWGTDFQNLNDVPFTQTPPTHPEQRKDWWFFVQKRISSRFMVFSPKLMTQYQQFLQHKYKDLATLNAEYKTSYASWDAIILPQAKNHKRAFADLESEFLEKLPSPEGIALDGLEFRWKDYLKKKYNNDLAAFNKAHGSQLSSWELVQMPLLLDDWHHMIANRGAIKREMSTRNYKIVWSHIALQAKAVTNTLIFCALKILIHLIVNPLAAYALSRFQPRWGYTALFILMATMAFPDEVQSIPSFLLIRDLGWLNTLAALVIPGAANGYSIFLLKGFFDSLPKDLYESATLDGASEMRIFWTITIPLSTPILAVIALSAFTGAYGAFMFALLVCQDESMWTIMVYIYQLQQMYNTPIVFASLIIAAVPTLFVFIFCQNIIMRGIVVPVEI